MRTNRLLVLLLTVGIAQAAAAIADDRSTPEEGKIPVTTASAEARTEFLAGRDLSEKLKITDSIAHFQKAASLDPAFATAELNLALTSPTGKGFFEHLQKAVRLAEKASNGERLLILATDAGAKNDPARQKELLDQLVAAYPNDERAHLNLGNYYFGQQEYAKAIEHYKRATELNANLSTAYNILGYAYRQNVDYPNAEKAFQKYTQLIPNDPNPYDSYAELLLKMGRFDDSIVHYRKAISIDPNFVNAHQGIAMDLMLSGKPDQAAAELQKIGQKARTDGERRTGMFARTVLHIDQGRMQDALRDVDEQYALGEKTHDVPAMAFDRQLKGNILLEMGKPTEAAQEFRRGVELVQASDLSPEVKANAKLVLHYNLAKAAAARHELDVAKKEAEEFRTGAETSKNPNQRKQAHELTGILALAEKQYDKAIVELQQANQQDPYNLYRLCQAYRGKGDAQKANEWCAKASGFNGLPNVNYAFVRSRAKTA